MSEPKARLSILREAWTPIRAAMEANDGLEDGGFVLARIHPMQDGLRLVADEYVELPKGKKWRMQEPSRLAPTTEYMSHTAGTADLSNRIPVFIHNHPPNYAQFSSADEWAHEAWAPFFIANTTRAAFASLIVAGNAVIGDLWIDGKRIPLDVIQVMDAQPLRTVRRSINNLGAEVDRQSRIWKKEGQRRLRSGRIAVIGAGGTGSAAIEHLTRTGVGSLLVIDPDHVSITNLNRLYGSTWKDATDGTLKVDVAKRHNAQFSKTLIDPHPGKVDDEGLLERLLACDVLLGCTDSHASRAYLNEIALRYGIPYIDGGVKAHVAADEILGQWVDVRRVIQGGPCLWCMKAIDPQRILAEALPQETLDQMVKDGYIQGEGIEPSSIAMTTLAATIQCTQAIAHLLGQPIHWPENILLDAWSGDQLRLAATRGDACLCRAKPRREFSAQVTQ